MSAFQRLSRLGELAKSGAADLPKRHRLTFKQFGKSALLATRLSAILASLWQRQQSGDKLKANQFTLRD
jgi:hypothetical protein